MCPLLAGLSWPCPQGQQSAIRVLGKGKILLCYHILLKLKERLPRMGSLQNLRSFSELHSKDGLCPETGTFLPGQSNDFLNNPKEGLSGARKLWTRTMWSRAMGSGLARPTPKSDKASRCQFAIWSPWKASVWKSDLSLGSNFAAGYCDDLGAGEMNLVCFCVSINNNAGSRSLAPTSKPQEGLFRHPHP